ncbi:MAG: response regulator [Myxococcota bacterium]|nr:response regulator [Myxococcota bacterium]
MARQILVVDDSVTIRKAINITFAHEDFDLQVVESGSEAIGALSSGSPDIALIDVGLPDQSGMDLARKIREDFPDASFPIILMTGGPDPLPQAQLADVGADAHIFKPFETQKLIDQVKEALGMPIEDSVAAIRFTPKSVKAQAAQPEPTPAPVEIAEESFDDATVADEQLPAAMGTATEVDLVATTGIETQADITAPPSIDLPPAIQLGPPPTEGAEDLSQTAVVPPPTLEPTPAEEVAPIKLDPIVPPEPTPVAPDPVEPAPEPIVFRGPPPAIKGPPPPAPAKPVPLPEPVAPPIAADQTSDIIVPPVAGDAPPPLAFSPPVEAHEPPASEPIPPVASIEPEDAPMLDSEELEEVEAPPAAIPAPEAPTMMVRAITDEPAAPPEPAFRPEPTQSVPALISQVPDLGIDFDLDSDDDDEPSAESPVDLNDLETLMPAIEAAVRKVTAEVVERVVWEVVPDLAERLIREKLAETDLDR